MNLSNKSICEREKKVLSSIQKLPYCPIAIKSGKVALLYDYDGNEYIDFLSSASSANLGHGHKENMLSMYQEWFTTYLLR